jgi:methyl-accepting chemotaxis protein
LPFREAARAGEQGRGFAVVAAEVRNLAQRSASAAKEIKGLIQNAGQKVEGGATLVRQSGQTLQEIVSGVKRVSDIVAEIAAASQEQAQGIEQVNKTVAQMDGVTQSNATQTEEISSTAQSLATHAQQLYGLVSRFTLSDGNGQKVEADPAGSAPVTVPVRTRTIPVLARPQQTSNGIYVNGHDKGLGNGTTRGVPTGFEEF